MLYLFFKFVRSSDIGFELFADVKEIKMTSSIRFILVKKMKLLVSGSDKFDHMDGYKGHDHFHMF